MPHKHDNLIILILYLVALIVNSSLKDINLK